MTAVQKIDENPLSFIERALANPKTNIETLEKLLDFQERVMTKQAEIEFNQALATVQAAMPSVTKNGLIKNKAGDVVARYMKYEDIDAAIRPILSDNGFSLIHDREDVNGKMIIYTTLKHRQGHSIRVGIPLPYDQPNQLKNAVQAAVSTFSYGKRVNVCSLLNIVAEGEDDDGSKAAQKDTLSDDQIQIIEDWLENTNSNRKAFLNYNKVESVADIPVTKYEEVIAQFKKKVSR